MYARGEGIVLNEPSVIALNSRSGEVLAMGHEAWQMIGRTPSYIVAVRPLRKGAITDFDVTQRMIRLLLQRVGVSRINRPRVVICVPSAITTVERRAVTEAAKRAGAADARLIEQPLAAAIGADMPINEPIGNMVVDIGGGTTETALISLGGVVALEAIRVGSFDLDNAIQGYVRREYGIAVGERTAEEIKILLGSAAPTDDEVSAEIRGRELMSGLPKTVVLTPEEVRSAIEEPVTAMVDSVLSCLAQAPPELAQDLIVEGIHLVGGGGLLRGMDLRLAQDSEVMVRRVQSPLETVVLGAGKVIEHYESVQACSWKAMPAAEGADQSSVSGWPEQFFDSMLAILPVAVRSRSLPRSIDFRPVEPQRAQGRRGGGLQVCRWSRSELRVGPRVRRSRRGLRLLLRERVGLRGLSQGWRASLWVAADRLRVRRIPNRPSRRLGGRRRRAAVPAAVGVEVQRARSRQHGPSGAGRQALDRGLSR